MKTASNTFQIFFDGGTGRSAYHGIDGYGSYEIIFNGFSKSIHKDPFLSDRSDFPLTNNVFEWLSLINALSFLQSVKDKKQYLLKIRGDSQLVIYQLTRRYKCHKPWLKQLRARAMELLKDFKWEAQWIPRREIYSRFGH